MSSLVDLSLVLGLMAGAYHQGIGQNPIPIWVYVVCILIFMVVSAKVGINPGIKLSFNRGEKYHLSMMRNIELIAFLTALAYMNVNGYEFIASLTAICYFLYAAIILFFGVNKLEERLDAK